MNCKRLLLSIVVVFILVSLFQWLWHGVLLDDLYAATASLWRSKEQMQQLFWCLMLGQFIFSVMFTFIFVKGYIGGGVLEGVRYGFWITLLMSGSHLVMYAVSPYPTKLIAMWLLGDLIQNLLAGSLAALVYKCAD